MAAVSESEVVHSVWGFGKFHDKFNPFLSHAFLSTLEHSASAVRETGCIQHHIVAKANNTTILAVVPLYVKTHSYG